jgi:phage shock protein PspC (stress-responsive transcriptional regulator)
MNLENEKDPIDEHFEPGLSDGEPHLRRSVTKRMVGGVASGIGVRFDIDANIVRAVFVVLAFLWGFGVAMYLALWALVPKAVDSVGSAGDRGGSEAEMGEISRSRTVVLYVGAVCFGLIIWAFFLGAPRLGTGVSVVWVVFLVALAVLSLRRPARRISLRQLVGTFFLAVVTLFIIAGGSFLGYIAMTGVPIAGGIGEKIYGPTSIEQIQRTYQTAFGNMTVDLRQVPFKDRTLSVTATVAAGDLLIEVPPGVVVDLSVQSGTTGISYPQGFDSFYVAPKPGRHQAHLVLEARVGVGQVELVRATPRAPQFPN